MATRYADGGVSVTLTGADLIWVRKTIERALGATLEIAEREAEQVARSARAEWYARVTKETGASGSIEVITTVDVGKGEVRVAVGSTDATTAGKGGKPRVVYIKAPRADSLIRVQVTPEEYWSTPEPLRANYKPYKANPAKGFPADPPGSGPYVWKRNPKASDGKNLLETLVKKPMRLKIKELGPEIAKAIALRAKGS